jgi:hypothetical protein
MKNTHPCGVFFVFFANEVFFHFIISNFALSFGAFIALGLHHKGK